jgi:hypothetical protein
MRHTNHRWMPVWGVLAALVGFPLGLAAAETAAAPPTDVVTGAWQHHKVTFNYTGLTSLYTCSGLEGHVRQILVLLGARKDLHVSAMGCPGPANAPSRSAWVTADFYTLAPAPDAAGADAIRAQWTALEVAPLRPSFMGDGDCELVDQMKDLITQNFSLRDVEYRARCIPNELYMNSYAVRGRALRAVPSANAVRG